MFAGIWTGDAWLLPLLDVEYAVVFMRVTSLVLYLVFGGITWVLFRWWRQNRHSGDSVWEAGLLFGKSYLRTMAAIGFLCFLAGFSLMHAFEGPLQVVGFVLTKAVGAPLSIAAVLILGQLPRPNLLQTISFGTFGAFLVFATMKYLMSMVVHSSAAVLAVCAVLFLTSFYCGSRCAEAAEVWSCEKVGFSPGVIGRSKRQVFSLPITAGLLMVSTMLGFVRNTTDALAPSDALAVASVVFLVMVFVRLYRGHLSLGSFFQAGVVCLAVSALLIPIAFVEVGEAQSVLAWAASACLEVVAISMCSWAAHNSRDSLMAAVLSRIVMVTGHLLGTLLVQTRIAIAASAPDGVTAGSLLLIFLFMLLVMFSYRAPQLQVMLFSMPPKDFEGAGSAEPPTVLAEQQAGEADAPREGDSGAGEDAAGTWRDHHQRACEVVAEVYGLTRREGEVLYMLAQGRTIGYMRDHFVLSQNTLKMHIRHIYQKLDVHSKQEVIDIVGAAQDSPPAKS